MVTSSQQTAATEQLYYVAWCSSCTQLLWTVYLRRNDITYLSICIKCQFKCFIRSKGFSVSICQKGCNDAKMEITMWNMLFILKGLYLSKGTLFHYINSSCFLCTLSFHFRSPGKPWKINFVMQVWMFGFFDVLILSY